MHFVRVVWCLDVGISSAACSLDGCPSQRSGRSLVKARGLLITMLGYVSHHYLLISASGD